MFHLMFLTLCAETTPLERASVEFSFHLNANYKDAAPLFGALAEKQWAPDWNPEFLYPRPPADREGAALPDC